MHFQGSLDPHVSTTKLHLDRFSRYCRIPLLPSHRARVVGHMACCSCRTMRSNNCMARIYARHKTGLKSGIHTRTSLRRSYRRIKVLTLSASELWRSGTDGKYRPRSGCSKPAARRWCLLGTDWRNRQTDTVPLHRRLPLEAVSVNNQQNRERSNRISTFNFLRFVKRYACCKDAFYAIDMLCYRANAMTH